MKNKVHFFISTQFMAQIIVLITCFSLFFFSAVAPASDYLVNQIVQLPPSQTEVTNWHQLVIDPSNQQQYFITSTDGKVYLVDDLNKTNLVLDLKVKQLSASAIKLTAFELHPNFSLRDQLGYGTFYTAHIEALDKNTSTKRIQERSKELALNFDAVVTEWQFSSIRHQKVDGQTKREILRIAVPDSSINIKQLAFSPHKKSWNDDFGLLYIALNGHKKWQKPLYSGAILRINPVKFGLRSFTVPQSNPFLKAANIKNEIFLLGGQNIEKFIWPDKNGDDILLSHHYDNKRLLSLTNGQNDWREQAPKKVIYRSDNPIDDVLSYRGRNLPSLRNKLLLLSKKNQQWLVESLNLKPTLNQNSVSENKAQYQWMFNSQQFTNKSDLDFSVNTDGEVLVLDKSAGMIFQVFQDSVNEESFATQALTTQETPEATENSLFPYVIFFIIIIVIFYWFKRNRFSAKSVVRKQFAHIELSESNLQIGLYHRHQKSTETIINIVDIASFEVRLNEQTICLINQQSGHGFNHDIEQGLRNVFATEQVDKMIDGKIRQINLLVTDVNKKAYTICLYMRKGSDRITKKTYSVVIDDVIDWCWLIAEKINSAETEKRKKKAIIPSEEPDNAQEEYQRETPLHNQAAAIRNVTHEADKATRSKEYTVPEEQLKIVGKVDNSEKIKQAPQYNTVDTELVNALEKLVELKQQGFLTQAEFIKAKENLMQSLFDK